MSDVHDEIQTLMPAYALGAIPAEEVPAIRAHIMSCEICFSEAESYADALAALAFATAPEPLPAGFADRVVAAALSDGSPAVQESPAKVRGGWFARWTPALGFAAAALATLLIATSVSLVNALNERERYQAIVAAMVNDDGFNLEGAGGAQGRVLATNEGTVLITASLGEAPEGRDYQLWLMKDGTPTAAETFDVEDGVAIVRSQHSLEGYDGAAVTVEPEGGSTQPTTDPVMATG